MLIIAKFLKQRKIWFFFDNPKQASCDDYVLDFIESGLIPNKVRPIIKKKKNNLIPKDSDGTIQQQNKRQKLILRLTRRKI